MINTKDYLLCINVEDTPYMLWQLELFIWSTVKNQYKDYKVEPQNILAVFTLNNPGTGNLTELSTYAKSIIEYYDIKYVIDNENYGHNAGIPRCREEKFGKATLHKVGYLPINKPCSLIPIFNSDYCKDYKFIVLLEADLFAYGGINFDKFPTDKTSIAQHWVMDQWAKGGDANKPGEAFDQSDIATLSDGRIIDDGERKRRARENDFQQGIGLKDWLETVGGDSEKLVPGSCMIWFKKEDLTIELIDNMILWTNFIATASTLSTGKQLWTSELPCYSLALAKCNVDVEKIECMEFDPGNMSSQVHNDPIPIGSLIHYTYSEIWPLNGSCSSDILQSGDDYTGNYSGHEAADGYFNKRCYGSYDGGSNNIFYYIDDLKSGLELAVSDHSRAFFQSCLNIARTVNINRNHPLCNNTPSGTCER